MVEVDLGPSDDPSLAHLRRIGRSILQRRTTPPDRARAGFPLGRHPLSRSLYPSGVMRGLFETSCWGAEGRPTGVEYADNTVQAGQIDVE